MAAPALNRSLKRKASPTDCSSPQFRRLLKINGSDRRKAFDTNSLGTKRAKVNSPSATSPSKLEPRKDSQTGHIENDQTQHPPIPQRVNNRLSGRQKVFDDTSSSLSELTSDASSFISDTSAIKCRKCKLSCSPGYNMLFKCSSCPRRFHRSCSKPAIDLRAVELDRWQCARCVERKRSLPARAPASTATTPKLDAEKGDPPRSTINRAETHPSYAVAKPDQTASKTKFNFSNTLTDPTIRRSHAGSFTLQETGALSGSHRFKSGSPQQDVRAVDTVTDQQQHVVLSSGANQQPHPQAQEDTPFPGCDSSNPARQTANKGKRVRETSPPSLSIRDTLGNSTNGTRTSVRDFSNLTPREDLVCAPDTLQDEDLSIETTEDTYPKSEPASIRSSKMPSYTIPQLIGMALCQARDFMLTSTQIFTWICTNFPYFKLGDKNVRGRVSGHLSLGKDFVKQQRPNNQAGRGGYWLLHKRVRSLHFSMLKAEGLLDPNCISAAEQNDSQVYLQQEVDSRSAASERANANRKGLASKSQRDPSQSSSIDSAMRELASPRDKEKILDAAGDPLSHAHRNDIPYEVRDNGQPGFSIWPCDSHDQLWTSLRSHVKTTANGKDLSVDDVVTFHSASSAHGRDSRTSLIDSRLGQVIDIRQTEDDRLLALVNSCYRRSELELLKCDNYRLWPGYAKWIRSNQMDIVPVKSIKQMEPIASIYPRVFNWILDIPVGGGHGATIRRHDHHTRGWLKGTPVLPNTAIVIE
ncbi:MAG: hypothetical protein M1820_009776 [Bogoriella megaspora]|nr:MAG: hypothetical protein M1820_009776 [Bogoriella megaspora]